MFVESKFVEGKKSDGITLDLDEQKQIAILYFEERVSNILKRTAIRQARSIVKTGFLLASGARIGQDFQLEFHGAVTEDLVNELSETKVKSEEFLPPPPPERPLEEDITKLTDFFWEPLDGRVYKTWEEIPLSEQTTIQFLLHLGKDRLTDEELDDLFPTRAENDRERFQEQAWLITKAHGNN